MDSIRVVIGIFLLIAAVGLFYYMEDIKDDKIGFFGAVTIEKIVKMCNGGWGDIFNLAGQCLKVQGFYYSPWISGFVGIIFLAKAGPYRGYQGYGGAGSHNRPFRLRRKTKKRLMIIIPAVLVIASGIFLYANYDITIADQRIDDIIPLESFEDAFDDAFKGIDEINPVKIEERP